MFTIAVSTSPSLFLLLLFTIEAISLSFEAAGDMLLDESAEYGASENAVVIVRTGEASVDRGVGETRGRRVGLVERGESGKVGASFDG